MVTKKDIDTQCTSFSSSTLMGVVENGTKTNNIVCNMSIAINSLAHLINIGDICRAPITRTFLYHAKIALMNEHCTKLFPVL
jgi:activator of 2-hydroxyglutaryl-CoA dehydratase